MRLCTIMHHNDASSEAPSLRIPLLDNGVANQFRTLIESFSDYVWQINEAGIYTYVSSGVKTTLGYEPDELLGKTPFNIMPPDEA